jgi:hypothetical protein
MAGLDLLRGGMRLEGHHRGSRPPAGRPVPRWSSSRTSAPATEVLRWDFEGNAATLASVLYVLESQGEPWRVQLLTDCPYCGSPHCLLVLERDRQPFVHCQGEDGEPPCTWFNYSQAVAGATARQRTAS